MKQETRFFLLRIFLGGILGLLVGIFVTPYGARSRES